MGAKVRGAGTETLTIVGVDRLHGAVHNVVQDRIEAGTFMVGAAHEQGGVVLSRMLSGNTTVLFFLRCKKWVLR